VTGPARLWHSSLRLRLTVTATLLAAVTLAVAGSVAITLYHNSLTNSVWRTVTGTVNEVASNFDSAKAPPDPIPMPVGPGVPRVQVLDSRNHVITGDPVSAARSAMYQLQSGRSSERSVVANPAFMTAGSAAVYALRTVTPQGEETFVAALSLDPAWAQTWQVARLAGGLTAVALAVVAAVSWLTAGRSLRPVERLRLQAATIAASGDLSGRLAGLGTDELARLGGTLNEMLKSLEESVDRQRRFVADAAHELRTPLAGMTTALEVAQTHPQTSQTLVNDLLAGHRQLGRLVNDLLILAAIDGRAARRPESVDLAGVITDCSRRPLPDGISLRLGHLDRVFVAGDETQLSRLVSNLVDNALKYAGSTVELSARQDGDHVVISVSDDGPGIPAADRERIWERFTRLDDDRSRRSGGSGLGLAMVRELTAAHGGTVSVTDTVPAPGATFLTRLPVISAHQAKADEGENAPSVRSEKPVRHPERERGAYPNVRLAVLTAACIRPVAAPTVCAPVSGHGMFLDGSDQVIDLVASPDPELDAARVAGHLRTAGQLRGRGEVDDNEGLLADHPRVVAGGDVVGVART
jgi:signal transduction histidine kinase